MRALPPALKEDCSPGVALKFSDEPRFDCTGVRVPSEITRVRRTKSGRRPCPTEEPSTNPARS